MGNGSFSEKTRRLIKERARGRCEMCGSMVTFPEYHHRRPRGMGGTNRQESGSAANGLFLHPKCHATVESNREIALAKGWIVNQSDDPDKIPVLMWDGKFFLTSDGQVKSV